MRILVPVACVLALATACSNSGGAGKGPSLSAAALSGTFVSTEANRSPR
jgi:hypothetical protein